MTTTANLGLTLLESGQLQPDVTINQALSDIDELVAPTLLGINAQTGTSYTLAASDAGMLVTLDNANPVTVTVPANASEALPVGFSVLLCQIGNGQVSVEEEDSNVVVITPETLSLRKAGAQAALVKIDADLWLLDGNLEAA